MPPSPHHNTQKWCLVCIKYHKWIINPHQKQPANGPRYTLNSNGQEWLLGQGALLRGLHRILLTTDRRADGEACSREVSTRSQSHSDNHKKPVLGLATGSERKMLYSEPTLLQDARNANSWRREKIISFTLKAPWTPWISWLPSRGPWDALVQNGPQCSDKAVLRGRDN